MEKLPEYDRGVLDGISSLAFAIALEDIEDADLPENVDDAVYDIAYDTAEYICDLIEYADEILDLIEGRAEYYYIPEEYATLEYED